MEQPWPGNISRKRRNAIVPTEGFFDNLDAPPETIDERIMKAIGKLNSLPSAVEAQGNEATIMVTRKAERSLQWVHNHEGEIRKRAMRLSGFIGAGVDPQENAELQALLEPIKMPEEIFNGDETFMENDENASPGPSTKRKSPESSSSKPNKKQELGLTEMVVRGGNPNAGKTVRISASLPIENCGAVVGNPEGGYLELRCDICGGNSGRVTKKFLRGIRGFNKHFRTVHNESPSPAEIIARCRVREVPASEVHGIIAGEIEIQKRPCIFEAEEGANHAKSAET